MPIESIEQDVYNSLRNYNNRDMKVYSAERLWMSFNGKYTKQEIGYALQKLRQERKVTYSKKYGWLIWE